MINSTDITKKDSPTEMANLAGTEVRKEEAMLKAGALQNAILNSANFSSIATDESCLLYTSPSPRD